MGPPLVARRVRGVRRRTTFPARERKRERERERERERIFIELMTSDRKLKASREGSK